jgi:hypothetical protein
MFTTADRDALWESLIHEARADNRIVAAAITGSRALGQEDEWSDIDLAFAVGSDSDRRDVIADWTDRMYQHSAVHHVDVVRGPAIYRVFLLASTLQVDLAFWPQAEFGAIAPSFRLLFGAATSRPSAVDSPFEELVGMAWLYALHDRSSIARGRVWQAEFMISGMRDYALALACLRHGLPAVYARGADRLPESIANAFTRTLVRSLAEPELRRAFASVCDLLVTEVNTIDALIAAQRIPGFRSGKRKLGDFLKSARKCKRPSRTLFQSAWRNIPSRRGRWNVEIR